MEVKGESDVTDTAEDIRCHLKEVTGQGLLCGFQ